MSDFQLAALLIVFLVFSGFVVWLLGGNTDRQASATPLPHPEPEPPYETVEASAYAAEAAFHQTSPLHDPSISAHRIPDPQPVSHPPHQHGTVNEQIVDIHLKPPSERPSPVAQMTAEQPQPATDPDAGMSQIYVAHHLTDAQPPKPDRPDFYNAPPGAGPSAETQAAEHHAPAHHASQPAPANSPGPMTASAYADAPVFKPTNATPPEPAANIEPSAHALRAAGLPPSDAVQLRPTASSSASAANNEPAQYAHDTVLISTARRGTRVVGQTADELDFVEFDLPKPPRPHTPSIWSKSYQRPSVAHTIPGGMEVLHETPPVRAERIPVRAETILVGKSGSEGALQTGCAPTSGGAFVAPNVRFTVPQTAAPAASSVDPLTTPNVRFTLPPGALGND